MQIVLHIKQVLKRRRSGTKQRAGDFVDLCQRLFGREVAACNTRPKNLDTFF